MAIETQVFKTSNAERTAMRRYHALHKDEINARKRTKRVGEERERQCAMQRASYARHREKRVADSRAYYLNHKDRLAPRLQKNGRLARERDKERLFAIYGDGCARCGFADTRALQLDHINGGGRVERLEKGAPAVIRDAIKHPNKRKFQILCANCNQIKRHENKEFGKFRKEVTR